MKSNVYWTHELRQVQISHIKINSSYNAVILTKHHPIWVHGSTEHDGPICFPCHYPHRECLSRSILISIFLETKYSQKLNLFSVMLRLSTLKNHTHSWMYTLMWVHPSKSCPGGWRWTWVLFRSWIRFQSLMGIVPCMNPRSSFVMLQFLATLTGSPTYNRFKVRNAVLLLIGIMSPFSPNTC